MERQRNNLVLKVGFFLLILALLLWYIQYSTQECLKVTDIPRIQNNLYDLQLLNASKSVYIIKSGESSVYVDDKGAVTIPHEELIDVMTVEQLQELYFRYVENIQTRCTRMIHLGKEQDGGYHICESNANIPPGSCLVYSFGDGQKDHKHSSKVTFYSIGLGGSDKTAREGKDTWKIMTFGSIKNMLGHTDRNIDIVKIDTEAAEWDSLENMLRTGDIHKINVLILELHARVIPESLNNFKTCFSRFLKVLNGLYAAGFRIYYTNMWTACTYKDNLGTTRTNCHEVHFIRVQTM